MHINEGRLYTGDAETVLKTLPENSIQMCVTSPPYWGLRDYNTLEQIGAEKSLDAYIHKLVGVFQEVRRVLKTDGTLWLNLGDSFTSGGRRSRAPDKKNKGRAMPYRPSTPAGLKAKDLIGIPWRIALALQADGWYLRTDIIWHKPNCQPESVQDRPTRSHEYIFLLTKSPNYMYNSWAIKENSVAGERKNRRSVWSINTQPFREAHFAVFPTELVRLCVLAGSNIESTVLDPFFGSGTVGQVCIEENRGFIGIEISAVYVELARTRLAGTIIRPKPVKLENNREPLVRINPFAARLKALLSKS